MQKTDFKPHSVPMLFSLRKYKIYIQVIFDAPFIIMHQININNITQPGLKEYAKNRF